MTWTGDFTVRRALPGDLAFVVYEQNRNRESVGHLPTPAIADRLERGTLVVGALNGELAGYLLYDNRNGRLAVVQACIDYDARRRAYGQQIVAHMLTLHPDASEVRLRCAADLEANLFWRSLGFVCTAVMPGGVRRGRAINVWQMWLGGTLFDADAISRSPVSQRRVDSTYDDTDYMGDAPEGFVDLGALPRLAWATRDRGYLADRRTSVETLEGP